MALGVNLEVRHARIRQEQVQLAAHGGHQVLRAADRVLPGPSLYEHRRLGTGVLSALNACYLLERHFVPLDHPALGLATFKEDLLHDVVPDILGDQAGLVFQTLSRVLLRRFRPVASPERWNLPLILQFDFLLFENRVVFERPASLGLGRVCSGQARLRDFPELDVGALLELMCWSKGVKFWTLALA